MRTIFAMTLALALQGCWNCTMMGCQDAFSIEVLGSTDPGVYTFEVDADGRTWECTFELGVDFCPEERDFHVYEQAGDGFWVSVGGNPTVVDLRVSRDGEVLVEATFEPVYEETSPNGERCGPTCFFATDTVEY